MPSRVPSACSTCCGTSTSMSATACAPPRSASISPDRTSPSVPPCSMRVYLAGDEELFGEFQKQVMQVVLAQQHPGLSRGQVRRTQDPTRQIRRLGLPAGTEHQGERRGAARPAHGRLDGPGQVQDRLAARTGAEKRDQRGGARRVRSRLRLPLADPQRTALPVEAQERPAAVRQAGSRSPRSSVIATTARGRRSNSSCRTTMPTPARSNTCLPA